MARHCPVQQECPKCKGAHCGLLHSDSFKAAQAPKDATQEPETRIQEEKSKCSQVSGLSMQTGGRLHSFRTLDFTNRCQERSKDGADEAVVCLA